MRFARIAAAFLSLMMLVGCGQISEGDIYHKDFIPQHNVEVDDTTYIDTGNGITVPIFSSHTETIPNQFFLDIRKMDEKSGKWLTRRVNVTRDTYDKFQEGDFISFK